MHNKLTVIKGKENRRTLHNGEWWFSVADVVQGLTDSADSWHYINKDESAGSGTRFLLRYNLYPLVFRVSDGKRRTTNCANTEGIFRITQFIPSPKAEPFKFWLAKVGYERV